MNIYEESLKYHEELKGKYQIKSNCKITNSKDLSLAYTPGVAEPCRKIHKNTDLAYTYTRKWNTVAVISDGKYTGSNKWRNIQGDRAINGAYPSSGFQI